MKALLLCAGQGTRLKGLTAERPKPMLPVAGRPLLEHLVEWLRDYDIRDIAINLHHYPEAITDYFEDGSLHGISITYSYEDQLLGTAGAAKQLQPFLDQCFVVAYGDVLTNLDLNRLAKFHAQTPNGEDSEPASEPAITMSLYRVPDPTQCGVVELDNNGFVTHFVEKPAPDQVFSDLAFSGVMICQPSVLDHIPAGVPFDFGHDLLPILLEKRIPVRGVEILPDEYVIDIGTLPGYRRAQGVFSAE